MSGCFVFSPTCSVISSNRPQMTMSSSADRTHSNATPRALLIRAAFRLEWLTVAWMVVEAAVALAVGVTAGSAITEFR